MVGIRCGVATLGAHAVICIVVAGRMRAGRVRCTGTRHTLRDGAREAGGTSDTAGGDRGPAAESKIVASWQIVHSWSWPSVAKGGAGNGLARTLIN